MRRTLPDISYGLYGLLCAAICFCLPVILDDVEFLPSQNLFRHTAQKTTDITAAINQLTGHADHIPFCRQNLENTNARTTRNIRSVNVAAIKKPILPIGRL